MTPQSKILCGIDMGSSKVAVLISSVLEGGRVNLLGVASVPSRGVKKGQIVDIESTADTVKECLKAAERMAGHKITSAFMSIGGAHIESINTHAVVAISPDRDINGQDLERLNEIAMAVAVFNFAANAQDRFIDGDLETKRDICKIFGTSLVLNDKKLEVLPRTPFVFIKDALRVTEPNKIPMYGSQVAIQASEDNFGWCTGLEPATARSTI